ncbi:hypothetical protein RNZ50_00785 [Paracoccaceae bacterium Fryx2]|nr:hypothetical protein [Paracoccaceae bacterium Fryx2]
MTPDRDLIAAALRAGAGALCRHQAPGGLWRDYDLPVGVSDEWVTALVGLCLAGVAAVEPSARPAAAAAESALTGGRCRPAGLGFNRAVAADADSTATGLLLAAALGRPPHPADPGFLAAHVRPDGGVATFHGPLGWGRGHACVTPVAALALRACGQPLPGGIAPYARRMRGDDGFWPAYWWPGPFYATAAWLRLGASCGLDLPPPARPLAHPIHTAMDLALALEIALHWQADAAGDLVAGLLACQGSDGRWPPSRTLRVTDPDCTDAAGATGALYADHAGLVTTAMAVRALGAVLAGASRTAARTAPPSDAGCPDSRVAPG